MWKNSLYKEQLMCNMKHQSSGGWCISDSRERRKKSDWLTCLHSHSLAIVGSRVGMLSFKRIQTSVLCKKTKTQNLEFK